jgi:hypothetical protein
LFDVEWLLKATRKSEQKPITYFELGFFEWKLSVGNQFSVAALQLEGVSLALEFARQSRDQNIDPEESPGSIERSAR